MKILLYGLNCAPELTGIGKYTGEMAAWLHDMQARDDTSRAELTIAPEAVLDDVARKMFARQLIWRDTALCAI